MKLFVHRNTIQGLWSVKPESMDARWPIPHFDGTRHDMLCVARAIEDQRSFFGKRCAVGMELGTTEPSYMLWCPIKAPGAPPLYAKLTQEEALDLAKAIRARIDARVGDYSIGSRVWPGTSKLIEEVGELGKVLGKLIAIGGATDHWSGDLRKMLIEELGDVAAAIRFFSTENMTTEELAAFAQRSDSKLAKYREWHADPQPPSARAATPSTEGPPLRWGRGLCSGNTGTINHLFPEGSHRTLCGIHFSGVEKENAGTGCEECRESAGDQVVPVRVPSMPAQGSSAHAGGGGGPPVPSVAAAPAPKVDRGVVSDLETLGRDVVLAIHAWKRAPESVRRHWDPSEPRLAQLMAVAGRVAPRVSSLSAHVKSSVLAWLVAWRTATIAFQQSSLDQYADRQLMFLEAVRGLESVPEGLLDVPDAPQAPSIPEKDPAPPLAEIPLAPTSVWLWIERSTGHVKMVYPDPKDVVGQGYTQHEYRLAEPPTRDLLLDVVATLSPVIEGADAKTVKQLAEDAAAVIRKLRNASLDASITLGDALGGGDGKYMPELAREAATGLKHLRDVAKDAEKLSEAVTRAGFFMKSEEPILWCKECQRDSGFHHAGCSKVLKSSAQDGAKLNAELDILRAKASLLDRPWDARAVNGVLAALIRVRPGQPQSMDAYTESVRQIESVVKGLDGRRATPDVVAPDEAALSKALGRAYHDAYGPDAVTDNGALGRAAQARFVLERQFVLGAEVRALQSVLQEKVDALKAHEQAEEVGLSAKALHDRIDALHDDLKKRPVVRPVEGSAIGEVDFVHDDHSHLYVPSSEYERVREKLERRAPAILDRMRAGGWLVAVHNDYVLGGKVRTFWAFSKGDKFAKGEGDTDTQALTAAWTAADKLT